MASACTNGIDTGSNNRGSVVLGPVAYYMDRYGYDVLPLAQSLLAGETLPPRTATQHILVTAANVFRSCARRRFPPARHQRDRMAYEHATRGFSVHSRVRPDAPRHRIAICIRVAVEPALL